MPPETFYRPGLVFNSKCSGHQEVCRGRAELKAMDGSVIDVTRELLAEFAFHGGDYSYTNPETGETERAPDIRGNYFDLDQQAEAKNWNEDEKEIVARWLLRTAGNLSSEISLWSRPAAGRPWPKYDEADAESVADFAEALGLTSEALSYELENKNRPQVVKELSEFLAGVKVEESLVAV